MDAHAGRGFKKYSKTFQPKAAASPVTFEPGTMGKVEALARRLEAGEELWHPADLIFRHDYYPQDEKVELFEYLQRIIKHKSQHYIKKPPKLAQANGNHQ